MKRASIDVGSNTILLLVGEYDKRWLSNSTYSHVTGLGKGIDKTKKFAQGPMELSFAAFEDYAKIIEKNSVTPESVVVTATEASRVVTNADDFFSSIKKKFGLSTTLIASTGEAYYTARGVVSSLSQSAPSAFTIIDIGGASTELIHVETEPSFKVRDSISLPMGAVRGTDWMREGQFEAKVAQIFQSYNVSQYRTKHLICVAGSMTAIGAMLKKLSAYSDESVQGSLLTFSDLISLYEQTHKLKIPQLLSLFPFLGKRSETIMAGLKVGMTLGQYLGVETFEISTFGLRHGTLIAGSIEEEYVIRRF
ncbi:MAG: hypothetical protein A2X86_06055 [Bdellovibrionales bacterium GWA2_49_15]|nr:MAG: hypothetical protein A2X86_06055 [Bdellovibrionales bacterium GWA2_49_15]